MSEDKTKSLDLAIGQIDRAFGKGALIRLGDVEGLGKVESISTGSISLDMALGIGGIPHGRVTEIFGAESSGKSTVAYHIMANAQKD